jgi:GLPGLI family protein
MWQSTFPSYGQRHIVYKNYPEDVITIQDAMGQNYYMYEDTLNNQAWHLEEETQTIIGFHCQKAVCEWRGRSYTAWFTEEIPMSDGPYKFCGLPGLIVQVYDKNREYEWTLLGVQRVQNKEIYLSAPVNYDADKSYEPYDRRELLRKMNKSNMGIAKKLNADDIMLGKEPHISSIRDLIELDYK